MTVISAATDEILAAGRHAYAWNGGRDRHMVVDPADGQLWSSHSRLDPNWHLPVVDMDMQRTGDVESIVQDVFHEGTIEWVPSTTEGHHHVYVEGALYETNEYFRRLNELAARLGVTVNDVGVLTRYINVNFDRGATFVRMPHVKKQPGDPSSDLTAPR